MRVLQINATSGGSTGQVMNYISEGLMDLGFESYLAVGYGGFSGIKCSGTHRIGNYIDHKLHALYSRVWGSQGLASRRATNCFVDYVDTIAPDVIHIHNIHNNYINYEILFSYVMKRKIPTVITLHDCWCFTGKCCHFVYDDCSKWKEKCGDCPRIHKEIPSYFFDRSKADLERKKNLIGNNPFVYIVGCSEWITNLCKQSVVSDRVIGTIHNGIDTDVFFPRNSSLRYEKGLSEKYVIMGMANKWLSNENQNTLNYIIEHLNEDESLLLVGCTKEQLVNLPPKTIGLGFVRNRDRLAEIYSSADVFVNTTKADTFPTVNLEALACGTPVVTYSSGGSGEMLTDDVGRSVMYGDFYGLRTAINEIKELGKNTMNNNCVDHIRKSFGKQLFCAHYIDLYSKIIKSGKDTEQC